MESKESIILDALVKSGKIDDPQWNELAYSYSLTLKRLEHFKSKYSAHDLKEMLLDISKTDMFQVLGTEASDQMWKHLQLAMEHLHEIPDSHLSALIDFHLKRQSNEH